MKLKQTLLVFLVIILIGMVYGCTDRTPATDVNNGLTQSKEALVTEENQAVLLKATPPPKLTDSLERRNLIRRLLFLNVPDRMLYVALMTNDGKLVGTYVTHKVSSVNSMLTTPQQIVPDPFIYSHMSSGGWDHYGMIVDSPDLDGSYGSNGQGMFFFTTDGIYVEWPGLYLESSQAFTYTTPPIMINAVK